MRNIVLSLIFIFILDNKLNAQKTRLSFEHIPLQPGVSHNMTQVIYQDSRDFIWLGTIFGLVRFDGYEYIYYQNSISDSTTISANHIRCIFEDQNHNLWVGTWGGGLNRYNRNTNTFSRFLHNPDVPSSISNNNISAITDDADGNIWVGTQNGLNKIDKKYCNTEVRFQHFFLDLHNVNSLPNDYVRVLYSDRKEKLWIGTNNGLCCYKLKTKTFDRYFHYDSVSTYRYDPKLINFVSGIINERPATSSILNITDLQSSVDSFFVKKTSDYLIVAEGEGYYYYGGEIVNKLYDTGWLEYLNKNKVFWKFNFLSSLYAGGGQKNRLKIETLKLNPGKYRLRYISDDSHSTAHWNHQPPDKTEWYGIQILQINSKEKEIIKRLIRNKVLQHPNSISDNVITTITSGFNNNYLWIGTASGGLNRFDLKTGKFTHFTNQGQPNHIPSNYVTSMIRDKNKTFWVGTNRGLSKFNSETNTFQNYYHYRNNPNSISSDNILSIMKDKTGILWLGTNSGNLDRLNNYKQPFRHFRIDEQYGNPVNANNILSAYAENSNIIWLGTNGSGLFKYNLKKNQPTHYIIDKKNRNILNANIISSIVPENNRRLWLGTIGAGLIRLDVYSGHSEHFRYNSKSVQSLSSNYILTLYKDSKNRLWIGTGKGVNLKTGANTFKRFRQEKQNAYSGKTIYSIYEDHLHNIWFGTCNGLLKFNESSGKLKHFPLNMSGSSLCVYDIKETDDANQPKLWLGTSNGLLKFDPTVQSSICIDRVKGLEGLNILGIEKGSREFLWLSTYKGLVKYNPQKSEQKWFDTDDGLQSNMFNMNAHLTMQNNRLLFGGINGFNIIDPDRIKLSPYKPEVHITSFKVFNKERNLTYTDYFQPSIKLGYADNFFTIKFAALDYRKPLKNQYKYRLKGIDRSWVHLKNIHSVSYTNVPPGNYIFEVMGSNSHGVWNSKKSRLKITIVPPFWRTTWFMVLLGFLFLTTILFIIYSIKRREKRKTELNKKISELKLQALRSRMNPHFIFNTINAIQFFISENAQENAYFYLSQFSKLLRTTLNISDKAVIPLEVELDILELYLSLQKLRYENKLNYSIKVQKEIERSKIAIPSMLIQPYIENAIEHGIPFTKRKGHIKIRIQKNTHSLICIVKDDGIGINQSIKNKLNKTEHNSKGMQLTRERLRIVNESISQNIDVKITDLNDVWPDQHGTKVIINIPFIQI